MHITEFPAGKILEKISSSKNLVDIKMKPKPPTFVLNQHKECVYKCPVYRA
jgi:hypothetical protein